MKNIEDKYDAVTMCAREAGQDDPFGDNLYGECIGCGHQVRFRPHSPHGPRIALMCMECAIPAMLEMGERGEPVELVITEKAAAEASYITGHKIEPMGNPPEGIE